MKSSSEIKVPIEREEKDARKSFFEVFIEGEALYSFWNFATKGVGGLNSLIVISSLSLYQYGLYQLLLAAYAFLSVIPGLGSSVIHNDITRFIGEKREKEAKKLFVEFSTLHISFAIILWVVVFFGAPIFLSSRFGPDIIRLVQILSFLLLFEGILRFMGPLLTMRLKFGPATSRSSLAKLVQLGILLYFSTFATLSLHEVLIAQVVAAFASILFILPPFLDAYRPWRNLQASPNALLLPIFKSYGKWAFFRPIINKLSSSVTPWIIKTFVNTEAVAIFSVAKTMVGVIKDVFPTKTLTTIIPLVIRDKARSQQLFTYSLKYLVLFSCLVIVASIVVVPPLIVWLLPQYAVALPFFYIILLSLPVTAADSILLIFMQALRKQKFLFVYLVSQSSLALCFYAIVAPLAGLRGLSFEPIVTGIILFGITYWYLVRIQPGVKIEVSNIFSFREGDKLFLKNIFQMIRGVVRKRLRLRG